jgi:glycerol kinase
MAKNTYGTGSFVLLHTGNQAVTSRERMLTSIAWRLGDAPVEYALEGAIFVTGAAVQWLRDGLGIIDRAADTEPLAAALSDNDDVYFVPALTGLGAPHWDPHARGLLIGITRGTGKGHLVRAVLESMAHQTRDVIEAMQRDTGLMLPALRCDGGAAANGWLMQFQADILDVPVEVPSIVETPGPGCRLPGRARCGLLGEPRGAGREMVPGRPAPPGHGCRGARAPPPALAPRPRPGPWLGAGARRGLMPERGFHRLDSDCDRCGRWG